MPKQIHWMIYALALTTVAIACSGNSAPATPVAPTPDIQATIIAAVQEALATQPTATPVPPPTPVPCNTNTSLSNVMH